MSSSIYDKITEVLTNKEIVNRHSYFQLRYFLVGKEPTYQSRMWRAIRELESRKETIDAINLEVLDLQDRIELLDIKEQKLIVRKQFQSDLDKREIEIELRRLNRKRQALKSTIQANNKKLKEAEEEADFLIKSFEKLEEYEPLKPYDDMASQLEYWNAKITQEIQVRNLMGLPLDPDLMKTTLALDGEMPVKKELINTINQRLSLQKKELSQIDTDKRSPNERQSFD